MRRNLVSPLGLFAAHAAASLVNIRFLFHGRTTPVQWLCFAVTLLYIGYWLLYSRKVPNAGITAYTVLFFVFMAFAAGSTVIAVFQNIVSFATDLTGCSVKKAVAVNLVVVIILSLPCALGFNVLSAVAPWLWIAGALVSTAVVLFSLRVKHRR